MRTMRLAPLLWCALDPASSAAQRIAERVAPPRLVPFSSRDSVPAVRKRIHLGPLALPRRDSSWWVPLTSTLLPGMGQALLGQDRFIAYLAVEGFALLAVRDRYAQERRQRDESRALARDVARAFFPGDRPVGDWHYYESMEKYVESGVFNRGAPGGDFTPESDATSYNGFLWLDVRQRYWKDPNVEPAHTSGEYRNALNEYIDRAFRPEMRWSWRNAQLEQDIYRQTIRRKNEASHAATVQLGVLTANHLLSTIDAFVTVRLRGGAGAGGAPPALTVSVPWAPFGRPTTP